MTRQANSWFGMIVGIVSIGLVPGACSAQQGQPTIEQILKVWEARQEKVATARFELSCERTIHKGSSSFLIALSGRKDPSSVPNPPQDHLVKGTSSVSLSGPKLCVAHDTQKWDPVGKTLYPEVRTDVFDGNLFKFLNNPSSNQTDYPLASIRKAKASESALHFPIVPLIFLFRGSHPQFFHDLGRFEVTGRTITVGGRSCVELTRTEGSPRSGEAFYLDRDRGYVVIRKTTLKGDKPTWQLDITYAPDATVGWVPQAWEYIIRAGKGDQVMESGRCTVTGYELNAKMTADEFDIHFPARTRVLDGSSDREIQYLIQENGEKGREIPTANRPSYEDLQKPRIRFSRGVWISVFVVALGAWIRVRWRRMVRGKQIARQS